ncbi:MAG: MG2 domain-containing protein, partial [Mucilaginibacter sp.]
MVKLKLIIACLLLSCFRMYGQDKNNAVHPVVVKLKTFLATHLVEKAYLQFDKPFYAAGDTVYFKAYVTLGERHKLSNLSGVLRVDLINTNNKIDQSIKLQLTNGLAWGDFLLPDSLPKGNYRIRAYTQWMRNEGNAAIFERIIPVGSAEKEKIGESMPAGTKINAKPDVQFFPEGGNLVSGIRSKIAFKAIGTNGRGIDA